MPLKTHLDEQPSLNLASMMDVAFLLIFFFMLGSKFTDTEHAIELEVPQVAAGGALTTGAEKKVVNVYPDGRLTLDRQPVSLEELRSKLAAESAQHPDLGVMIRGDAHSQFQRVAEVLNACKRAGLAELAISVRILRAGS